LVHGKLADVEHGVRFLSRLGAIDVFADIEGYHRLND